jgi:hypothetical protein
MIITAKFASTCSCCRQPIAVGSKIEWSKGSPAKHVACSQGASTVSAAPARRGSNWDPSRFNGYGRPKGGYRKACISDGNCSSIGSGRSCGGHDCDGF